MSKERLVHIRWVDSSGDARWISKERVMSMKLSLCESVGILIAEDDEKVTIGQSIDVDEDNYNHVLLIPKFAILYMVDLRKK